MPITEPTFWVLLEDGTKLAGTLISGGSGVVWNIIYANGAVVDDDNPFPIKGIEVTLNSTQFDTEMGWLSAIKDAVDALSGELGVIDAANVIVAVGGLANFTGDVDGNEALSDFATELDAKLTSLATAGVTIIDFVAAYPVSAADLAAFPTPADGSTMVVYQTSDTVPLGLYTMTSGAWVRTVIFDTAHVGALYASSQLIYSPTDSLPFKSLWLVASSAAADFSPMALGKVRFPITGAPGDGWGNFSGQAQAVLSAETPALDVNVSITASLDVTGATLTATTVIGNLPLATLFPTETTYMPVIGDDGTTVLPGWIKIDTDGSISIVSLDPDTTHVRFDGSYLKEMS